MARVAGGWIGIKAIGSAALSDVDCPPIALKTKQEWGRMHMWYS